MIEVIIGLIALILTGYLIVKKHNPIIVLFSVGLILLFIAALLGHPLLGAKATTGSVLMDPFKSVQELFLKQLGVIGLTIMVLFGFSGYMTHIGANEVTVRALTKPLTRIKSPYILVPIMFLVGNLLSLVVPSASSLAVLLMATLYPVLKRAGMSSLTAGAVIATTATVMPTPLGADNVVAAKNLGLNLVDYVYNYHAKISIPTILIVAVAHYFWQKYMDKKQGHVIDEEIDNSKLSLREDLPPAFYGILPLLPLILIVIFFLFFKSIKVDVITLTIMSLFITAIIEMIRHRSFKVVSEDLKVFFKGMGDGVTQVVTLLVAAGILVQGLQNLGVIDTLTNSVKGVSGAGITLMLILSGVTALIGFISGSGLAMFYAFIELIPAIAQKAAISGIMLAIPMQLTANLIRPISPVAAVIIVVASITKKNPIEIVKRTAVPMIIGIIASLILTVIMFPV